VGCPAVADAAAVVVASNSRQQPPAAANSHRQPPQRNSLSMSLDDEVQVVILWDAQLKLSPVYESAFEIFSGKAHKSPPLDMKRDML